MVKKQTFLRNGNQQIGRYGYPYLRLHGVLAGAKEHHWIIINADSDIGITVPAVNGMAI